MLYFIPAWYLQGEWREIEQIWYMRRMHTEMDDTVKQIQLFQRNDICEFEILLLSYAPNLRHFLHRQSMFRAPYWSVFDAIQEVRRKKPSVFSFHNLNWPEDVEFIYTPFSVFAMLNHEKYARIEFGEYGNLIEVNLYRDGQVVRRNVYDDRGFVSCTTIYEAGKRAYDQYLTEQGIWKLCHFADGHVAVNPRDKYYLIRTADGEVQRSFLKEEYASLEEVIEEVFTAFLETTVDGDIFCAAAHKQHFALLDKTLRNRIGIYSIFENRIQVEQDEMARRMLSHADCIVADSEEAMEVLARQEILKDVPKENIPPYDTRIETGISQKLTVQKILVPIDHLEAGVLEESVKYLAAYLEENKDARVHFFTRKADYGRDETVLRQVQEILECNGYPPGWARKENDKKFEFLLDEEEQLPILFVVEQCIDELSANKCIREQRVLVDLAETPDLFLQVSCVSMGIPQILRTATQYMRPGKNGRLNQDLSLLGEDLRFYLESMSNWNHALIQSYELGKKHTTQYLMEQWKEVIASVGKNSKSDTVGGGGF